MRRVQKPPKPRWAGNRADQEVIGKEGNPLQRGKTLTAEQVKYTMHCHLLEHGCTAVDTIVSCGEDTAIPHMTGTGPLKADEPIVIDLFPVE